MASVRAMTDGRNESSTLPTLMLEQISKSYDGVLALDRVDLVLRGGEIHGLVGENGSGKSTLIKVIGGVVRPDSGRLLLEGRPVWFREPRDAERSGIVVLHQDPRLCPHLSVVENVLLGHLPHRFGWVDWRKAEKTTERLFDLLGAAIPPKAFVSDLTAGQRQLIVLARALSIRARWLLLDEPTAPLTASEVETLFKIVMQLKRQGVGILFVSHRVEEVLQLCDRVSVLRDGCLITTRSVADVTAEGIIRLMSPQATLSKTPSKPRSGGRPLLMVQGFTTPDINHPVSLTVHSGEIVGFFGLVGSGRTELAQSIVGLRASRSGTIALDGNPIPRNDYRAAVVKGIAYLPEDRLSQGVQILRSIRENIALPNLRRLSSLGFIDGPAEKSLAERMVCRLAIRCRTVDEPVSHLSGGNQQKVALARWLAGLPDVLILDEPTHGVDISTKAEIHRLISEMKESGRGIILISSELPELMALADRIVVFRDRSIVGEFTSDAPHDQIFQLAVGTDGRQRDRSPRTPVPTARPIPVAREITLILFVMLLTMGIGIVNPNFLDPSYWLELLQDSVPVLVVTGATAALIISGNLDLSVGSVLGASAMLAGQLAKWEVPILLVVCSAIAFGASVALVNGFLTTRLGISSVIVTLGTMSIVRGATLFITKGNWVTDLPDSFRLLALGRPLLIPNNLLIALAVGFFLILLMSRTHFGRQVYAVGSSVEAAHLAGIPTRSRIVSTFILCGSLTGLAGALTAAQFAVVQSETGKGFEMQVITAALLGGVGIFGGTGTVGGALVGALTVSVITSALTFLGVPGEWGQFCGGLLILMSLLSESPTLRGIVGRGCR